MNTEPGDYRIFRERVSRYYFWLPIMFPMIFPFAMFMGVGIIFAIIYSFTMGTWLPQKQAGALRYWLEGTTLRVDQGVYFLQRKAIPLDRVTDIVLAQGPLLRFFGIWSLKIQTAGAGSHAIAEANLVGLEEPEEVRNELLAARDAARKNMA